MRKMLTCAVAALLGTVVTLVRASPAAAAAYTVWSINGGATTTYHTGMNRIVVCDKDPSDGRSAYGTLEYWTGASWHWVGQARDRDGGLNGTCDELVGASVPADRWIKFMACVAKYTEGSGWEYWDCRERQIYDDGES